MSHSLLRDAKLYELLSLVDHELAAESQAAGCHVCGGRLHSARYPRKFQPRGGAEDMGTDTWRFSFCCAREGCRRRTTLPSAACGKFRWPPGPTCDRCLADDYAWSALGGTAKVLSWTTFHRGYFPECPAPHTIVALELAEGRLFISYPVGLAPSELREGMIVEVRRADGTDRFGEYNLPVFGPPPARG